MSVPVPSAGDSMVSTWGDAVANQLNTLIPVVASADTATTSTSPVAVTGLSFPVQSGKMYNIRLCGLYTVGGTSTGLGLSWALTGGATGTVRVRSEILSSSVTDATADTGWPVTDSVADGETTTTDTTQAHLWTIEGVYQCTHDGTFGIMVERNGTSTTVTILKGSGGLVVSS